MKKKLGVDNCGKWKYEVKFVESENLKPKYRSGYREGGGGGCWCTTIITSLKYHIWHYSIRCYSIISNALIHIKTRWHCANPLQPIKGFHFLRLYRIKWAICEYMCLYIVINDKATPLIVTLLWCFNTVLNVRSRFIYYYLVLLCNIIYIQSKSYVNVYISLK